MRATSLSPASGSTPLPSRRFRVLAVDDNESILIGLEALLGDIHDVQICHTPAAAFRHLATEQFDVLITDFQMPGMTGSQLVKSVLGLPNPVGCLFLTGTPELVDEEIRGREQVLGVLSKPYDAQRLLRQVDQLGRLTVMRRGLADQAARAKYLRSFSS